MAIDCDAQMVARTGVAVTRVPEPRRPPGPGQSGAHFRACPDPPRRWPRLALARTCLCRVWLGRQFGVGPTEPPAATGPSDPHSLLVCPVARAHVCCQKAGNQIKAKAEQMQGLIWIPLMSARKELGHQFGCRRPNRTRRCSRDKSERLEIGVSQTN